ncbi:D,D-heptose 1,7-bisphosphate phosphatase [Bradyrhizobium sp. USDA 3686]|uniref:HAD-IIIA family hydrolase n=1 Tax=Bradyrhizobium TaxID=374 RepID=UPI00195EF793|nr:HAD-IIIA family hydrolase [Bradyrhizobium canariense]MBM7484093.1 D-glycero-D-manno-heptose 1,7-bisphosphate phosphatase [Bradyrhizobium canariense]UFW74720.1 HAD-IIIA family hydrolase [Bradyrhizobium canariense]
MLRQAVILVGGLGTRLGERTRCSPKPLLEVGGRPFIDYLLDELTRYPTIQEIVLLAGYRAEAVVKAYHGKRWRGASVTVVCEPYPCGTGGALKHAAGVLQNRFFLLNGDSWFDFNLLDLALRAQDSSAIVHMALKRDQAGDRYGRVLLEKNRVRSFLAAGAQPNGPINTGIYCINRAILQYIDEMPCSLEQQVFLKLVAEGHLAADLYDGFFIDIGIPSDFEWAQHEVPERLRRPAVFFDRDGVLNVDKAYVYRIEDFEWANGAREAIKLCNDLGYYAFVVTNQSGVARGYYGVDDVHRLHDWMNGELAVVGAHIDDYQYCPYHEEGTVEAFRRASDRRKPAPGMILDCMKAWPVRKEGSLLVGDNSRDVEAARAAGLPGHLYREGDLAMFLGPLLSSLATR